MSITPPDNWVTVDEADFREYLKTCRDYRLSGYANGFYYEFRHNNQRFAILLDNGEIKVTPDILVK